MSRDWSNERQPLRLGALLVDLENLYLGLKKEYADAVELTVTILQALRTHLMEKQSVSPVVGRAYSTFDDSDSQILKMDLALIGIEPVYVLDKPQKSSADLALAVECTELIFRRPEIQSFTVVGGDRDYIPLVKCLLRNARAVQVVSPGQAMSGDLLKIVGDECYLDPIALLLEKPTPLPVSRDVWEGVAARAKKAESTKTGKPIPEPEPVPRAESEPVENENSAGPEKDKPAPRTMAEVEQMVEDSYELDDLRNCMALVLKFMRDNDHEEVWLGPFLKVMNDAFPMKANSERKALLNRLCEIGAARIIDRPRGYGEEGTYATLLVARDHPLVKECTPDEG